MLAILVLLCFTLLTSNALLLSGHSNGTNRSLNRFRILGGDVSESVLIWQPIPITNGTKSSVKTDLIGLAEVILNNIDQGEGVEVIGNGSQAATRRPSNILIFIDTILGTRSPPPRNLSLTVSDDLVSQGEGSSYYNDTFSNHIDGPAPVVIAKGSNVTTEKGHPTDAEACLTPYCISISARLLNSMNLSADPCHDFYEYSCGGWIKENNIPDGQSSWNNFQALFQKNQYILKRILEKDDSAFQSRAELKAKIYYDSCLDENDTIEALGAKPLLTLLNRYGGWNISAMKDPLKKDRPSFNLTATHLPFLQTEEGYFDYCPKAIR